MNLFFGSGLVSISKHSSVEVYTTEISKRIVLKFKVESSFGICLPYSKIIFCLLNPVTLLLCKEKSEIQREKSISSNYH